MNKLLSSFLFTLIAFNISAQSFSTGGNAIRHTIIGSVNGESVLYIGELDGSLSSYTIEGKKLWRVTTHTPAVLFEIEAVDINNDGNDDLIAANANGNIYCYDSSGKLLWQFTSDHKVRFSEVAVVKNNGKIQVFAGGNDYTLYELDAKGKLISKTRITGVVRKLESGNFTDTETESLFLMTYDHDKFRWDFLGLIDPYSKEVVKSVDIKKKHLRELTKIMVTDIGIADINNDKKDEILLFGDQKFKPFFAALDGDLNSVAEYKGHNKQTQRYAHSQGTFLPSRNEFMFQHGGILLVLDNKGKLIKSSGARYGKMVYSDFAFEPKSNQLIAAGTVDGGNTINFYDLTKDNWFKTTHRKEGRMLEVQKNITSLYKQTLNFKLPKYQTKPDKEWVMITKSNTDPRIEKLNGANVTFVIQKAPKESTDRSHLVAIMGDIALKKDKRGKYLDSREDIVQMARDFEAKGQPFAFWAGHGNDPFYIQIETLEQVLEVAPNTCYGFIYAEMANAEDPRVIHYVKEYIPRLAKAIRKNNKAKLYFRYKNMFWAATAHLPLWKDMFFSKKYSDILAPASEDTSNRTQDLNLAGRVGMHSGGYVNDYAMRLIDDNPTSWRPLSPGGQNSVSPYLRQGVIMAAYGARYGVVSTSGFVEEPGLNVLFALMKSGVLPIVEPEDILSIGSWHLIKDVDDKLIHSVDDHHKINQYKTDDDNAVFSVSQMHWAGTSIPKYDFSNIALGVKYRWTNYMPELPHGMVPVAPIESKAALEIANVPYFVSDTKAGYKGKNKVPADEFGATIENTVESGKKRLNIVVKGASWSAIKIDDNHTRLVIVDQGYINPQERTAAITFQNKIPKSATDILNGEIFAIKDKNLNLKIPAGSMRFIDVAY
ncbi:WD40 repeat domain-containing protein [Zobellia uliginosa]|uniref:WD40 repeat domain-containing protein n=1 Tax=Zobellia uliginosa TaxID=143224 RepID=UPI001C07D467|nr:WD40 repeat domain-containing protein [Zobellia uliginosa]MBU2947155.1 hypothetical protein [Zobellia uliginosa]